MEQPWESPEMSGPIRELRLLVAGTAVPNKEWDRSFFLIRLYGFMPLRPLLLWTLVYPYSVMKRNNQGEPPRFPQSRERMPNWERGL